MASGRENVLSEEMDNVIDQYEELQTLSLMASTFGNKSNMHCLDWKPCGNRTETLWDLGTKLNNYRKVYEEYMNDPFYLEQKAKFDRRKCFTFCC